MEKYIVKCIETRLAELTKEEIMLEESQSDRLKLSEVRRSITAHRRASHDVVQKYVKKWFNEVLKV